jgi:hypothetical protein
VIIAELAARARQRVWANGTIQYCSSLLQRQQGHSENGIALEIGAVLGETQ